MNNAVSENPAVAGAPQAPTKPLIISDTQIDTGNPKASAFPTEAGITTSENPVITTPTSAMPTGAENSMGTSQAGPPPLPDILAQMAANEAAPNPVAQTAAPANTIPVTPPAEVQPMQSNTPDAGGGFTINPPGFGSPVVENTQPAAAPYQSPISGADVPAVPSPPPADASTSSSETTPELDANAEDWQSLSLDDMSNRYDTFIKKARAEGRDPAVIEGITRAYTAALLKKTGSSQNQDEEH